MITFEGSAQTTTTLHGSQRPYCPVWTRPPGVGDSTRGGHLRQTHFHMSFELLAARVSNLCVAISVTHVSPCVGSQERGRRGSWGGKEEEARMQRPGRQHFAACALPGLLGPVQNSVLRRNAPISLKARFSCSSYLRFKNKKAFLSSLSECAQVGRPCWRLVCFYCGTDLYFGSCQELGIFFSNRRKIVAESPSCMLVGDDNFVCRPAVLCTTCGCRSVGQRAWGTH